MKTRRYWKIRKIILNWIFRIKKIIYGGYNRRQSAKAYKSFWKILFIRTITMSFKVLIFAAFFLVVDIALLKVCDELVIDKNIFADVIIGELGVSGVILGLYCSNISSVYSTRYSNAPEKIAKAFQYDLEKCDSV